MALFRGRARQRRESAAPSGFGWRAGQDFTLWSRGPWAGAAAALAVLGMLALRSTPRRSFAAGVRQQAVLPVALILGVLGILCTDSRILPVVSARAATLTDPSRDPDFAWRRQVWAAAG